MPTPLPVFEPSSFLLGKQFQIGEAYWELETVLDIVFAITANRRVERQNNGLRSTVFGTLQRELVERIVLAHVELEEKWVVAEASATSSLVLLP